MKVLFIFGTRPEAIKLGPVIRELRGRPGDFDVRVCVTAQHREMLDQILKAFEVTADYDLNIMRAGQTLYESTSRMIAALGSVVLRDKPDAILVQGDTTTTLCGALAAFYSKVPIGHVEAGLRTGDVYAPFPEEMNRLLTARLATAHFAATEAAAQNLYREGVKPSAVTVTGNTGIDAVLHVKEALAAGKLEGFDGLHTDSTRKLIVVTAHRRESFGEGFDRICGALKRLARRDDIEIVYPVHPNPNVQAAVGRHLAGQAHIKLLAPLDYVPFVDLMRRSYFLMTDSGGIQEEAPALGKPVLVLREVTERMEGVTAGTAILVGTDETRIVEGAERLLEDPNAYQRMSRQHSPYGDGKASARIADSLTRATLRFGEDQTGFLTPTETTIGAERP
jgi:UDP-N-acetylglucosamine 2-epimerase (non-hydrolysing)